MPLILAGEPDPLRIAHVTALTRGKPRTELIIAESLAAAVDAVAARLPDVVLISPTVSAEDRELIARCLEAHGPAAARVRTFTTPAPAPVNSRREQETLGRVSHTATASAAVLRPSHEQVDKPTQDDSGLFQTPTNAFSSLTAVEPSGSPGRQPEPGVDAMVRVISY